MALQSVNTNILALHKVIFFSDFISVADPEGGVEGPLLGLFYAPPTIVEGHYLFWSVAPFVRPSVRPSVCGSVRPSVRPSVCGSVRPSRLKFLVKVVFDEAEVQST